LNDYIGLKDFYTYAIVLIADFEHLWQNFFWQTFMRGSKHNSKSVTQKEAFMFKHIKKPMVIFLIIAFATVSLATSSFAQAVIEGSDITTEEMTADALLVHPLGLVAIVLGAGLFVISLPFSLLGRNVGEAGSKLVVAPAKFTFVRPLGEF
jgi:hypothetical protein